MDLLEHPLEAVAFRLYSLPDASAATGAAAWTCLAAVLAAAAAAAGLWRLRASSAPVTSAAANTKPLVLDLTSSKEAPTTAPSFSPEPAATSTAPSPKERYTAYFINETGRVGCCGEDGGDADDREDDAEEHDGGVAYRAPSETATEHFAGWEEVVRTLPLSPTSAQMEMRLGRYRSPRAVGSVVQLWDQVSGGGLTPTASPRRRGRVVATVPGF
ncbi:unnamed protein product [Urochloa humidicola]